MNRYTHVLLSKLIDLYLLHVRDENKYKSTAWKAYCEGFDNNRKGNLTANVDNHYDVSPPKTRQGFIDRINDFLISF